MTKEEYQIEMSRAEKAYKDIMAKTGNRAEAFKAENEIVTSAQKRYELESSPSGLSRTMERAYYDWATNDAYLSGNGYRLKSTGKKIAPWNKEVNAKYPNARYGDGSTNFHNDAMKWAEGKDLQKHEFERLQDINQDRYSVAKRVDNSRTNKITVEPYDPRVRRWKQDQGSMDVLGVDSPPSVTKATKYPRITPKMPKLK